MQRKNVKFPIIGLDLDDDDRSIPPGYFRRISNCIPTQDGLSKMGGVTPLGGTVQLTNAGLAAGTNTCIGAFPDLQNNRIVYFMHNNSNNHSIWYYNPTAGTHTKILQSSYLAFSLSYKIKSSGVIEDILYWTDGLNEPRSLKISDAVANVYATGTYLGLPELISQISVEKPRPRIPPTAVRATDGAYNSNNVAADSFQFSIQFVFRDNTVSGFSPLSQLVPADAYPDPNNTTGNYINVSYTIETDAAEIIKKVRYAYVKNGDGQYFIFKEQTAAGTVAFYNNEAITPVTAGELAQVNLVPQVANNLIIHNQRLLATMDQFDYSDVGTVSLSLSIASWNDSANRAIHLPGVSYSYGLVCFDRFGRTNGVIAEAKISIPHSTAITSSYVQFLDNVWVNWTISGSFPSWAMSFAVVRKRNDSIISSAVIPALVLFYKNEGDTAGAGEVLDNGKVFHDTRQAAWSDQNLFFKVAINNPISLDNSYVVRLLHSVGQTRATEPIVDLIGDKVITGNFGITDWTAIDGKVLLRLEKYNRQSEDLFYEFGAHYLINAGVYTTTGQSYGDHFVETFENYAYDPVEEGNFDYEFSPGTTPAGRSWISADGIVTESPTTSSVTVDVSVTSTERIDNPENHKSEEFKEAHDTIRERLRDPFGGIRGLFADKKIDRELVTTESKQVFAWDYSKACSSNGRVWTTILNKKVGYNPTTISISDKYVFSSQINGLNRMTNIYTISPERTPIRKLVDIGTSNVFIAIHERTTTSLATYSGDNVLRTSDGSEIIGDGKSVIGYDRELSGGYGTLYPDSVVSHGGRAWWFDPYSGEICRYAANGITPIGSIYKMKTFFNGIGKDWIDTTNRNVLAGYDSLRKIVYFTFRQSGIEYTYAFVDKEGEERWIGPFDFWPDRYVNINNRLFAFASGQLHEIGPGTPLSYFGGEVFCQIDHVFNTDFDRDKILRSISLSGDLPFETDIVVPKTSGPDLHTYGTLADWKIKDDNLYAEVKRHITTPGFASSALARVGGSTLIGKQYNIRFQTEEDFVLYSIGYSYQDSSGHRTF